MRLVTNALFDIAVQSGESALVCIAEMQNEDELFASANTLAAVEGHLLAIARSLADLPPDAQLALPELDWRGWQAVHEHLAGKLAPRREEVWYAVTALVPATLVLIERLRRR